MRRCSRGFLALGVEQQGVEHCCPEQPHAAAEKPTASPSDHPSPRPNPAMPNSRGGLVCDRCTHGVPLPRLCRSTAACAWMTSWTAWPPASPATPRPSTSSGASGRRSRRSRRRGPARRCKPRHAWRVPPPLHASRREGGVACKAAARGRGSHRPHQPAHTHSSGAVQAHRRVAAAKHAAAGRNGRLDFQLPAPAPARRVPLQLVAAGARGWARGQRGQRRRPGGRQGDACSSLSPPFADSHPLLVAFFTPLRRRHWGALQMGRGEPLEATIPTRSSLLLPCLYCSTAPSAGPWVPPWAWLWGAPARGAACSPASGTAASRWLRRRVLRGRRRGLPRRAVQQGWAGWGGRLPPASARAVATCPCLPNRSSSGLVARAAGPACLSAAAPVESAGSFHHDAF